ncbi:hypothetical protein BDF20DRAFT_838222 [Mycotypha africana]|uniref:uncharacterized protein n=1 Tax=Mycotypha africana TaxID=64632 RepID=UPI0023017511|nr:uncharacterized protein BDF20DRAFT_838222 [Mycotypha africana]KAI8971951.1 hypothetical protein BDF20DRAFT_838222 [Mycotypha africana]
MPKELFSHLPYELILKVSSYLGFADVWYLGTCSSQYRMLSLQLLKTQFNIDLLKQRLPHPLTQLIHAAVAYLDRYALQPGDQIEPSVLQSVANVMAITIYDHIPSQAGRIFSLDFLLDETLCILMCHCLLDPTLQTFADKGEANNIVAGQDLDQIISSMQPVAPPNETHDISPSPSTGVLMVDFLNVLYETLCGIFDDSSIAEIFHRLLLNHLQRKITEIRHNYQSRQSDLSSYACQINSHLFDDFKLFMKLLCSIGRTDLLSARDLDTFTLLHINYFFITKPSDVDFSLTEGFRINLNSSNDKQPIISTTTKSKQQTYYLQWKLWLEETQLRVHTLLDLLRVLIQRKYTHGELPEFKHILSILQETVTALSLSQMLCPDNGSKIGGENNTT